MEKAFCYGTKLNGVEFLTYNILVLKKFQILRLEKEHWLLLENGAASASDSYGR